MTAKSLIARVVQQEDINFLLTNRIPRRVLTHFMGWLSRIERPWVCGSCITLWRLFSDLDLSDAKKTRFKSLHECFTRELKDGARPVDADPRRLVSPCDALVGACETPTAFLHAQQQWFSQMMRDYLEQGNDATAKLRSAASDEVASVKRHARQDGNRDTA